MRNDDDRKRHRGAGRAIELPKPRSIAAHLLGEGPPPFWERAHLLWRSVPAHGFHRGHRAAVAECMRRTSSTMDIWRAAIAGDASSAVKLGLAMGIPERLTIRTDLTMTVLLHNALRGDAAATLVLSHMIGRMPIDREDRHRLAASWRADGFRMAWHELDGSIMRGRRAVIDSFDGEDMS